MFFFPPVPSWDGLHPLVIHFPIALLLVAPVFVILGLIFHKNRRAYFISALVLMILGTIGAYFAVETGEAAASLVVRTPAITAVLHQHHELGETTRNIFTILTIIYAVIIFGPVLWKKEIRRGPLTALHLVFLVFYMSGCIVLADTGHDGGLLVHEYGVQSIVAPGHDPGAEVAPAPEKGNAKPDAKAATKSDDD